MSLEDRTRFVEAIQKLGVGLAAVLILGVILGSYLWGQMELSRESMAQRHLESERLFSLMTAIRETNSERANRFLISAEAQTRVLEELADMNRTNLKLIEANSLLIQEMRRESEMLTAGVIEAIRRSNVDFLDMMKKSFEAAKEKELDRRGP